MYPSSKKNFRGVRATMYPGVVDTPAKAVISGVAFHYVSDNTYTMTVSATAGNSTSVEIRMNAYGGGWSSWEELSQFNAFAYCFGEAELTFQARGKKGTTYGPTSDDKVYDWAVDTQYVSTPAVSDMNAWDAAQYNQGEDYWTPKAYATPQNVYSSVSAMIQLEGDGTWYDMPSDGNGNFILDLPNVGGTGGTATRFRCFVTDAEKGRSNISGWCQITVPNVADYKPEKPATPTLWPQWETGNWSVSVWNWVYYYTTCNRATSVVWNLLSFSEGTTPNFDGAIDNVAPGTDLNGITCHGTNDYGDGPESDATGDAGTAPDPMPTMSADLSGNYEESLTYWDNTGWWGSLSVPTPSEGATINWASDVPGELGQFHVAYGQTVTFECWASNGFGDSQHSSVLMWTGSSDPMPAQPTSDNISVTGEYYEVPIDPEYPENGSTGWFRITINSLTLPSQATDMRVEDALYSFSGLYSNMSLPQEIFNQPCADKGNTVLLWGENEYGESAYYQYEWPA